MQRSVVNAAVVTELGDFSSGASMVASATYQQAGLTQFGFINSNPDFTRSGDRIQSTSLTQEFYQTRAVQWIVGSHQRTSVVYLESDWSKSSSDIFKAATAEVGLEVAYESPIQPDSEDYRPVLTKTRSVGPQAVVHLGYGPGGARIVRQLREIGFTGQPFGGQNTLQFLEAAGSAIEGTIIIENFLTGNDSPAMVDFNKRFKNRFEHDPSTFSVHAYDALNALAEVVRRGGAAREGVFKVLFDGGRWKTMQFGEFELSVDRRPSDVTLLPVTVKDGACMPAEAS